jgi:hypothetical protein
LKARAIDLDSILLPATFRLTETCLSFARFGRPYRLNGVLRTDHLSEQNIRAILQGGYGVQKHINASRDACLWAKSRSFGGAGIEDATDLMEEMIDPNACHPSIYRVEEGEIENSTCAIARWTIQSQ